MKFRISNCGPIASMDIYLNSLTIITGPSSSEKTLVLNTIYGLLRYILKQFNVVNSSIFSKAVECNHMDDHTRSEKQDELAKIHVVLIRCLSGPSF